MPGNLYRISGILKKALHLSNKGLLQKELAENPVVDVTKPNEFWKYNNYD